MGQILTIAFDGEREETVFEHAEIKKMKEKEVLLVAVGDKIGIRKNPVI